MADTLKIGTREIGAGRPVFIVAEAGVNHNGDLALAKQLVSAAARAGADAVKFQTFSADRLVTSRSPKAEYQAETTDVRENQYVMLKKLELSLDSHVELKRVADAEGVVFLSTPFDPISVDFLESIGVAAFKIGSGELTDLPLLTHIAKKGKPAILSTGMSDMKEIEVAVRTLQKAGLEDIALLHCVSAYPAPIADVNLRALVRLRQAFNRPVGFSDHTTGTKVAALAVACGATIVEKHLTLDRALGGPDHRMSLEPTEFAAMVKDVRDAEICLGDGVKRPMPSETNTRSVARKSLVALVDLKKGTRLTAANIGVRRPGTGIPPSEFERVIGRTLRQDVSAGDILVPEWLL